MREMNKYVYFIVALNLIPHVFDMPIWVVGASFTFLAWRIATDLTRVPALGKWGIISAGAISTLLVVNHYGTFIGDEASTATLLIMVSLKTFEMRTYRDIMVLTYLCYFLLMTKLIASQTIGMSVFMLVDIILITAIMMMYHSPSMKHNWRKLLRRSAWIALQGLPLLLALFFAFPRFTANLWAKDNRSTPLSGFSGQLNPGEVSKLVLSDEPAFRVYFSEFAVPQQKMYWRGSILTQSSGLFWTRTSGSPFPDHARNPSPINELTRYEIFLEPHGQKWLFALDWPEELNATDDKRGFRYLKQTGKTYESRARLSQREYYVGYSQTEANLSKWLPLKGERRSELLEVQAVAPKAQSYIQSNFDESMSSEQKVAKLLRFFAEEGFVYRLSSPEMKNLDEFLFEHKAGFCEHYAAAMGSLLRWSGVPSRVVIGYQGGTSSFLSDYLLVRQKDAHAWVEFWSDNQQTWKRVDPTSVVAPERLQLGAQDFFDQILNPLDSQAGTDLALNKWFSDDLRRSFFRVQMVFDQAEAAWMSMLLRYDFTYQQELFSELGLGQVKRWHLFVMSLLILILLTLVFSWRLKKSSGSRPASQTAYWELCQVLARKGLSRRNNEPPGAFAQRAINSFPEHRQSLESLFEEVLRARYGPDQEIGFQVRPFRRKVEQLRTDLKASKLTL